METDFDVIKQLTESIRVLNTIDEYLDSLDDRLSRCDMLRSDYEHIIENEDVKEINLEKLFNDMKENLNIRRKVKGDITLRQSYKNSIGKLNSIENRQFLLQGLNNSYSKLGKNYTCRLLDEDGLNSFKKKKSSSLKKTKKKKEEKSDADEQ